MNADYRTVEKFLDEIKYELDKWYENISDQNFQFLKSTCFDNVAGELKQPNSILNISRHGSIGTRLIFCLSRN